MVRPLREVVEYVSRRLGKADLQYYRLDHLGVRAIDPQIVWDALPSDVQHRVGRDDFGEVMITVMALHSISALREVDADLAAYDTLVEGVVG